MTPKFAWGATGEGKKCAGLGQAAQWTQPLGNSTRPLQGHWFIYWAKLLFSFFLIGRDFLKAIQSNALQWARTSSTGSGCSNPHPDWSWMFPGVGQLSPLGNLFQYLNTLITKISSLYPYICSKSTPLQLKTITPCPVATAPTIKHPHLS